jgi:hypothetical protein
VTAARPSDGSQWLLCTSPAWKAASISFCSTKGHHWPVLRSNEPQHTRSREYGSSSLCRGVALATGALGGPDGAPFGGGAAFAMLMDTGGGGEDNTGRGGSSARFPPPPSSKARDHPTQEPSSSQHIGAGTTSSASKY